MRQRINTPHIYTLIIIAGDYDVVNCIRQALPKSRFQLYFAYNHRDAVFLLHHQTCDGVIVDGRMRDRYEGTWTLEYVTTHFPDYRYAVYIQDKTPPTPMPATQFASFDELDPRKIMRLIAQIFTLPSGVGDTVSLLPKEYATDQHLARKIEEVNTLFALSRSLTQSLDLHQVFQRVVESAQYLTYADEALIVLPQDNALYVQAKISNLPHSSEKLPILSRDILTLEAYKTGQPILMNDANRKKYQFSHAYSALYVPIIYQGRVNGVLGVSNVKFGQLFTENQQHLLMNLATFAAIAIENARVHHDLEQSLISLKAAQARLIHTARLSAMGELATVVAHQMNNPLTTIIAETELMLADEPANSPRRGSLQAIARTGKRAANVARRLLAIARPVDIRAAPDYIDVVDSLRGVLSLLQPHIEHRGIELAIELPKVTIPPVRALKGQLEDIWLNLLMNAYDALYGRSSTKMGVKVQYLTEKQLIEIIVWDNGPGIPEEIQEKIFSPFFTTKTIGEGTGLGLHICREVIGNVGGTIAVSSQLNELTQFIVHLPVENRPTSISDYNKA